MNAIPMTPIARRSWFYRIAVFSYGIVCYAIGVAALLALMAVMLGLLPFTGGPVRGLSVLEGVALDALLLTLFALQHSVMARASFKARWTQWIPAAAERSTYVLATGLCLLPLLLLWQPMPSVVWSVGTPWLRWALTGLALAGWVYLFAASFAINHFELFGLQQVYQALRGKPVTPAPFLERWMYRFDRHPIMTGILIGIWATPEMQLDHLLFAIGASIYVAIGVTFEERALRRQWGLLYEDYRARVGAVVPTLRPADPGAQP